METKIVQSVKNPHLDREEITLEIVCEGTPTKSDITTDLKKDPECVVIKKIHTNFGQNKFVAEICVYETKDSREKIEVIPKKIRKKMEAEEKARKEAAEKKAAEEAAAKEAESSEDTPQETKESSEEKVE